MQGQVSLDDHFRLEIDCGRGISSISLLGASMWKLEVALCEVCRGMRGTETNSTRRGLVYGCFGNNTSYCFKDFL